MSASSPPTTLMDSVCVLVADHDAVSRADLTQTLTDAGHDVVTVSGSEDAVTAFESHEIDVVLLDVDLPGTDGHEAARCIRDACARDRARGEERFVSIIFLAENLSELAIAACLEAGGDDVLSKPCSPGLLDAKLMVMRRFRQIFRDAAVQRDALRRHQNRLDHERAVAQHVFRRLTERHTVPDPRIRVILSAMSRFNGDFLLQQPTPSGRLNVLLGDFTGHGLPAAVSAMPVCDMFYSMSNKGFAPRDILREIGQKLHRTLPTGVFLAATFAEVDPIDRVMHVWNAGNPDLLIRGVDGQVRERVRSANVPLGIRDPRRSRLESTICRLEPGERIYIFSDGIVEPRNAEGHMFGVDRVAACLRDRSPFDEIQHAIETWTGDRDQSDDMTLIEVVFDGHPYQCGESTPSTSSSKTPSNWSFTLDLAHDTLHDLNPIPMVIQSLNEIQGLHEHRDALQVVLAELFSNALDHGLLELDSALKSQADGFRRYYVERERRLDNLTSGRVSIACRGDATDDGGRLQIVVRDDGPGFDPTVIPVSLESNDGTSGRGIALVRRLCELLDYGDGGRTARAVYRWS